MGDDVATNAVNEDKKTVKATKKVTKRAAAAKKTPAAKKSKPSPSVKGKAKGAAKRVKGGNSKSKEADADGDETADVSKEVRDDVTLKPSPNNGTPKVSAASDSNPTKFASLSSNKMSIEEKRKALQAERLRKEQEMKELLEQEEALLIASQENETEEKTEEPVAVASTTDTLNQSADSNYDTRSEIDDSQDEDQPKPEEDFESVDDMPSDGQDINQSGAEEKSHDQEAAAEEDELYEESHVPPSEAGLAGIDDEEEEFADDEDVEEGRERAISPVTWDVDVHANQEDDNISGDSPLNSGDESESDGGEIKEDKDSEVSHVKSNEAESPAKPAKISTTASDLAKAERLSNVHSRLSTEAISDHVDRVCVDKKGIDAAEAMRPRVHKYLYREAKYFMVKSNNHENVRLAKAKGVWSTPPQNEIRFNKAVEENTTVILVFSVKESGAFQGFARINGPSQKDGPKIAWVLPPGISAKALSGVFKLDWVSRTDLSFIKTSHLRNPWNQNKPVKIARDGQEIECHVGESLCKLFTLDGSSDYERVISRVKRKREALQAKGPISSTRPPYRPATGYSNHSHTNHNQPHPHSRVTHSDYRGRGRGTGYRGGSVGGGGGGGYRGGRGGGGSGGHRGAPHSSYPSRHNQGINPGPHHSYPHQPTPYYTSGGSSSSNRSTYGNNGDYRGRHSYPSSGHPPSFHQPQPTSYHSAPAVPTDIFVKGSYEQYLDEMRRATCLPDMGNSMAMYDAYSASYHAEGRDAPPPPPIPSYSTTRDRDRDRGSRPSADRYDRAVEDFLRRTTGNSGGSSRSSRGGDVRHDHRYKGGRDPRDSRDTRDYRGRSRSRERGDRDRHRNDRR